MEISQLTARRPYLLRAIYEWLLDNNLTPHLVVNINRPGVKVPLEHAQGGQITLNIAPRAVHELKLGNEEIRFHARFGGVSHEIVVPLAAAMAIYARENGVGSVLEPERAYELEIEENTDENGDGAQRKESSQIRIIEGDKQETEGTDPDDDPPPSETPPRGKSPLLRVVK